MENKRPTGHKKNVTGSGESVYRRGEGLGTGPIGNGRPDNFGSNMQNIQEIYHYLDEQLAGLEEMMRAHGFEQLVITVDVTENI